MILIIIIKLLHTICSETAPTPVQHHTEYTSGLPIYHANSTKKK